MHEVHLDFKLINENRLKAPVAVFFDFEGNSPYRIPK
jgi:hypothetical protein